MNQKILFRGKSSRSMFVIRSIWNLLWFSIAALMIVGFFSCGASAALGLIYNDGGINDPTLFSGLLLFPIIIIMKIIAIIWQRKKQLYTITPENITSQGGVFSRFFLNLRLQDIKSVSFSQSLIQRLFGCGNVVISSAASSCGDIILRDVDCAKICAIIEEYR